MHKDYADTAIHMLYLEYNEYHYQIIQCTPGALQLAAGFAWLAVVDVQLLSLRHKE
jgi:hypothetical protein